ncbi:peptidylprolyl isomerase [Croceicoccus bisphenolivorans]|uniref:peptidylprolyl isomerase n=1 Tax=Croceicoccus bisphenolivorans TaxID=1783232 RepID=UPI0009EEF934|nr:peptidylprolyl isomerase [Croceicoccus bisphenolivorans]
MKTIGDLGGEFTAVGRSMVRLAGRIGLAAGAGALVAAPVAAMAQTPAAQAANQDDPGANADLNLPANPASFGTPPSQFRGATAIVNGAIITGTDIDQRLALVLAANRNEVSNDELERLRAQVLSNLIDETLQIQEAEASEVGVGAAEVDATYNRVSQQNFNMTPAQLDAYLRSIDSSPASMKRQIQGELSWQRILRRNIAPFINVSEEEVHERLDRLKADRGTEEFRLGEIFLSATAETKPQARQQAEQIMGQLRQGGSFVAYARQFSQASTAAVGGDLGWIRLAQLPPELAEAAGQMQPGQLVGPVELRGGYSLLYLIDKRKVLMADAREALLSLKQISISFPAGTSADQAAARAKKFAEDVQGIAGCGAAEAGAAAMGADIVSNDNIRVKDLPPQLQDTLLALPQGGITQPFGSASEGVRVLMLCGRTDPGMAGGPTFDELMAQIEDERINKRAQIYLRDLRRDAVIEYN